MANNIGYKFEIQYIDNDSDEWLSFKAQDGVVLSSDYQSGYTSSVAPSELILQSASGTSVVTDDITTRNATIIFTQEDTNQVIKIPISQDLNKSGDFADGDPIIDENNTKLSIIAANGFDYSKNIPKEGGHAYLSAIFTKALKEKRIKKDRYGKIIEEYYEPLSSLTTTENVTNLSDWTCNDDSVNISKNGDYIDVNIPGESLNYIYVVYASYSGYSATSSYINKEIEKTDWIFSCTTNVSSSTVYFIDEEGNSYSADTSLNNDKYMATYTVEDTTMPSFSAYVENNNVSYENGLLKLHNDYGNIRMIQQKYTWDNASPSGDTLELKGTYNGTLHTYDSSYNKGNPLLLIYDTDNYIELSSVTSAVSSNMISAYTDATNVHIEPSSGDLLNINVDSIYDIPVEQLSGMTYANTSVIVTSLMDTSVSTQLDIKQVKE